MSVDLNVFLSCSQMPTPVRWAQAIADAGFDVQLGSDFDVDGFTGYLPCKNSGVDSGFEYFSGELSAADREELELGLPDSSDFSVTFCTRSDVREFMTSLIAAGVLCSISAGTLLDPQSGVSLQGDTVLDWVRSEIAACQDDL